MEPSCCPLGAFLGHVGSHLEPFSVILSHIGGHLGAPEALLEPSWAKKDLLTHRGPPVGGDSGRRGGGFPSPKGRRGFGRGKNDLVRPPTPRGLVGFRIHALGVMGAVQVTVPSRRRSVEQPSSSSRLAARHAAAQANQRVIICIVSVNRRPFLFSLEQFSLKGSPIVWLVLPFSRRRSNGTPP